MIVKGDEACVRGAGGEGGRVAHDGQRLWWDASGGHNDHNGHFDHRDHNAHNAHNDHNDNEKKHQILGFWCSGEDGGNQEGFLQLCGNPPNFQVKIHPTSR